MASIGSFGDSIEVRVRKQDSGIVTVVMTVLDAERTKDEITLYFKDEKWEELDSLKLREISDKFAEVAREITHLRTT